MKLIHQLKMYDKFLGVKKMLNGTVKVFRKSPFSHFQFDVLITQNQYIGSGRSILVKINLMDSQKHDITGDVLKINRKIKDKKQDNRIHNEVADFMLKDSILIN